MATEKVKRRRTMTYEFLREVDDLRIHHLSPLLPPACTLEEQPITKEIMEVVISTRTQLQEIIAKTNDRMFVVVGPCSVHDTKAALEYARMLKTLADELKDDLLIVMRTYFEKPRTTVGWKGLINDPNLDGTFKINHGIKMARQFLLDVNSLGLPCAGEFLDTISPQFVADLISWGAIGARTTESQVHRELASGMSCPIGFKNGTGGDIKVAVDGCLSSGSGHSFLSVTKDGIAAIVHTNGNPSCHIILRGGKAGPNYEAKYVKEAKEVMAKGNVTSGIMIDCSHGNSRKIHTNQPIVAEAIGKQVAGGDKDIIGVMIESNINAGNQKLTTGVTDPKTLKYGVSVTDACIDFETTKTVLRKLAEDVRTRRTIKTNGHN